MKLTKIVYEISQAATFVELSRSIRFVHLKKKLTLFFFAVFTIIVAPALLCFK